LGLRHHRAVSSVGISFFYVFDILMFSIVIPKNPRKHVTMSTGFCCLTESILIKFFLYAEGIRQTTKGDIQMGDISIPSSDGNRSWSFTDSNPHEYSIQSGISFVAWIFRQCHSSSRHAHTKSFVLIRYHVLKLTKKPSADRMAKDFTRGVKSE
jgi:hypothetical protein